MGDTLFNGGTGARLTRATVIVAAVACLASSLLSVLFVIGYKDSLAEFELTGCVGQYGCNCTID